MTDVEMFLPYNDRIPKRTLRLDDDDDAWLAIQKNFKYVSTKLHLDDTFLGSLYEKEFIDRDEFAYLRNTNVAHKDKIYRLLVTILPTKPSSMFMTFCDILNDNKQSHIVERLGNVPQENSVHREEISRQGEVESLLDRERESTRQQPRRADSADYRASMADLEQRLVQAETQVTLAECRADVEKTRADREQKDKLQAQRRCAKAEADKQELQLIVYGLRSYAASCNEKYKQTVDTSLSWRLRENPVSSRVQLGSLAGHEGNLLIAGKGGDLHVITDYGQMLASFVRYSSEIRRVVSDQDICLVQLEDKMKCQFVIERFCMNGESIFQPVTVLPDELQLSCVSMALKGNLLYAVGGMKDSIAKEKLTRSTVCVYDLDTDRWSKLKNMLTKRSGCSCNIMNDDTVCVAGGWSDGGVPCDTVECLRKGSRQWEVLTSNPIPMSTMATIGNTLVSAGGTNADYNNYYSDTNEVLLFDKRLERWLSLPRMQRRRSWHSLLATDCGDFIAAGGERKSDDVQSIETLKF